MGLTWNGSTPTKITWNGNNVDKVTYNGTTIWEDSISGTWSHSAFNTRPWIAKHAIECTGTSLGSQSGGGYRYDVSIPIFHSNSNTNSYKCVVYLGASENATTINVGTFSFTKSGTISASVTSKTWLGNSTKIWILVDFTAYTGASAYLSVDSGKAITVTAST